MTDDSDDVKRVTMNRSNESVRVNRELEYMTTSELEEHADRLRAVADVWTNEAGPTTNQSSDVGAALAVIMEQYRVSNELYKRKFGGEGDD